MDSVNTENTFLSSPKPPSIPVPISSANSPSLKISSIDSANTKSPDIKISSLTNTASEKAASISAKLSSVKNSIGNETMGINFFTILRYILIVFIIIFLGYNLFAYLGGNHHLGPRALFNKLFYGEHHSKINKNKPTAKQFNKSGINKLNKHLNKKTQARNKIDDNSDSLGRALKHARSNKETPMPDDSDSRMQRGSLKPGFCYVGEDRGVRTCVKINDSDVCMSGDIFPSNAICVNPSLRE